MSGDLRCVCGDSECPSCGAAQGTRTRIGQTTVRHPLPSCGADLRVPTKAMRLALQAVRGYGEIRIIAELDGATIRTSQMFDRAQAITEAQNYAELASRLDGRMTLEVEDSEHARLSVEVTLPW